MLKKISSSQRHIFFWIFYIGYAILYIRIAYPDDKFVWWIELLHYGSFLILFYFVYNAANLFFKNQKKPQLIVLQYFIFGLIAFFGFQIIKNYTIYGFENLIFRNYIMLLGEVFLIIIFAISFSLIEYTVAQNLDLITNLKAKNEKILLLNRSKRNKEMVVRKLDKIVKESESEKMVPDLKEFKQLVDFLLNSTHKALIPIALEIENIKRYIHLYQMRSGNSNLFQLIISGEITNIQIPHKTILTLIENSIKHGDLDEPVFINISFTANQVKIQVRNKIRTTPNTFYSTNIGLENLKARLSLHLGGRFGFEAKTLDGRFEVGVEVFKIPLESGF